MTQSNNELDREKYDFPEGQLRLVNWREVDLLDLGKIPGLHGKIDTQLIIGGETAGAEGTVMGRAVFHPGARHDPHSHAHSEEFVYCLSGKGIVGGGQREYVFTPGDVQFIPKGEAHWLYNPYEEPVEFLWVYSGVSSVADSGYFTPESFDAQFDIIKNSKLHTKG